jgi:hypothetical protein
MERKKQITKEEIIEKLKNNWAYLYRIKEELKNDKEVVLAAIQDNGLAIKYASKELQNNKEVVLEAVKQNNWALEYASKELRSDKEFILKILLESKNGILLNDIDKKFLEDREIVKEAIKLIPLNYKYISKELRSDKEIFLEVINKNKELLEYASEELKDWYKKEEMKLKEEQKLLKNWISNNKEMIMKKYKESMSEEEFEKEKNMLFLESEYNEEIIKIKNKVKEFGEKLYHEIKTIPELIYIE